MLTVRGLCADPKGTLAGRTLRFFELNGGLRAITALPTEQAAGDVQARVTCGGEPLALPFVVQAPQWRDRELKVAKSFTAPSPREKKRQAADRGAFEHAWEQPFGTPRFRGNFTLPCQTKVTAPFGDRRMFNGKVESQHYGLDLDGKVGAPIAAANDGRVVMARANFASGNTVVLDHGAGLFTTYFHLSRIDVKAGAVVKRGQRLGAVGRTGRVTGPHLHFAARVDGLYVDPAVLLGFDLTR